jgi:hypothetical protein
MYHHHTISRTSSCTTTSRMINAGLYECMRPPTMLRSHPKKAKPISTASQIRNSAIRRALCVRSTAKQQPTSTNVVTPPPSSHPQHILPKMRPLRYYVDQVEQHLPFKPSQWDSKYKIALLCVGILLFIMALVAFALHDKV